MKIVSIIVSLFAVAAFANEPAHKTTTTTTEQHVEAAAGTVTPKTKKLHTKTTETKKTEKTEEHK